MNCPFCSYDNLQGMDECERCGEDLTAFDGNQPKGRLEKSLAKDPISSLHLPEVAMVDPAATVRKVAELLAATNRCVLVVDKQSLAGIVTERDLLFRFMGTGRDPGETPVADIMTPKPETLDQNDKLTVALNKMAIGGFRHIPLMRNGAPIGAVSVRDILEYLADMFPKEVRAGAVDPH